MTGSKKTNYKTGTMPITSTLTWTLDTNYCGHMTSRLRHLKMRMVTLDILPEAVAPMLPANTGSAIHTERPERVPGLSQTQFFWRLERRKYKTSGSICRMCQSTWIWCNRREQSDFSSNRVYLYTIHHSRYQNLNKTGKSQFFLRGHGANVQVNGVNEGLFQSSRDCFI